MKLAISRSLFGLTHLGVPVARALDSEVGQGVVAANVRKAVEGAELFGVFRIGKLLVRLVGQLENVLSRDISLAIVELCGYV